MPILALSIQGSSDITPQRLKIANNEYDYIVTTLLSTEVRDSVIEPKLLLYHSIQGIWEGQTTFNWTFINKNENMFMHDNNDRILTIYNNYLMNVSFCKAIKFGCFKSLGKLLCQYISGAGNSI